MFPRSSGGTAGRGAGSGKELFPAPFKVLNARRVPHTLPFLHRLWPGHDPSLKESFRKVSKKYKCTVWNKNGLKSGTWECLRYLSVNGMPRLCTTVYVRPETIHYRGYYSAVCLKAKKRQRPKNNFKGSVEIRKEWTKPCYTYIICLSTKKFQTDQLIKICNY